MFHKKNWFIFVLIVCTLPVYGQGNLLKNGIKTVLPRQRAEISPAMGFAAVDNKTQRAVLQDLHGLDGILKGAPVAACWTGGWIIMKANPFG